MAGQGGIAAGTQAARNRARDAALKRAVRAGERAADDPEVIEAARQRAADQIARYVAKVLAQAPPLSTEQRARLAELLEPARRAITDESRELIAQAFQAGAEK